MFERFTENARKVLGLARQEAEKINHEYIGTEHLLLGLILEKTCTGARVLLALGLDLRKIRLEIEKLVQMGPSVVAAPSKLPFTPRLKRVIDLSIAHAAALKHPHVGTEHLLLGLLEEGEGIAAQVLTNLDVKLDSARLELGKLLQQVIPPLPAEVLAATPGPVLTPKPDPTTSLKERRGREVPPVAAPRRDTRVAMLCPNCGAHLIVPEGMAMMRCNTCAASLALITEGGVSGLKLLPQEMPIPYSNPKHPPAAINLSEYSDSAWRELLHSKQARRDSMRRWCVVFASLAALAGLASLSMLNAVVHANRITMEPAMTALLASMGAVPIFGYVAGYFWDKYAMLRTEIADLRRHLPRDNF